MSIRFLTLPGYSYLYLSLIRFGNMKPENARQICYWLNTANLDSFRYANKNQNVREASPYAFYRFLEFNSNKDNQRPYRTEVQLYKSMQAIHHNIIFEALIEPQREAVLHLRCLMSNLENTFYRSFGMDIDDQRTVYRECISTLIPRENEPSVCLLNDWINLKTA